MTIKPRQPAPPLKAKLLDGSTWQLGDSRPAAFDMVVVYRGLHCPVCKTYLGDLEAKLPEFAKRGVDVIAISADTQERAQRAKDEWGLKTLRVGCELPISGAREWDLFVSTAIRDGEPPEFVEPGLFLIKPDGTLFYASRGSAPWGRPPLDQMLRGIDIATERKMPARGEA
ncbi:MAG: redoxin domain-containing protein [Rhizobiales bacterium]|nr:redoxin domain-containing protein [Hyphomicrobiales bacterium]